MKPYSGNRTIRPTGSVRASIRDSYVWANTSPGYVYDTFDTTSYDEFGSYNNFIVPNCLAFYDFGNPFSAEANPALNGRSMVQDFSSLNNIGFWNTPLVRTTSNPGFINTSGRTGSIPTFNNYDYSTSFSIGVWMRLISINRYGVFLSTGYNNGGIEFRRYDTYNQWLCTIGQTSRAALCAPALPAFNTWCYNTWTYDGATFKQWLNGSVVASVNYSGGIAVKNTLLLFQVSPGGGDPIWGSSDIGLFHIGLGLTDTEVQEFYQRTRGRFGV